MRIWTQEALLTKAGAQPEGSYSPPPPVEVRRDLEAFKASGSLVELYLVDEEDSIYGFLIFLGEDYVVVTRLCQSSWENGFRAIRIDRVQDVFEIDEEDDVMSEAFVRRARLARGKPDGPMLPFDEPTFAGLLHTICRHFPIVVLVGETPAGKKFDFAAHVSPIDTGSFRARFVDLHGRWEPGEQVVPVPEVYEVLFDSEYERTLVAMTQLDDA